MRDVVEIRKAEMFAEIAHEGQMRKWGGVAYITHPKRVAERVASLPEANDGMVCAAYLHDTIEDCGVWFTTLVNMFGYYIAETVEDLSNTSKIDIPGASREVRKKYDRNRLARTTKAVKLIKLCDRIENLIDVLDYDTPPDWARKYADESQLLYDECLKGVCSEVEKDLLNLIERVKEKYK